MTLARAVITGLFMATTAAMSHASVLFQHVYSAVGDTSTDVVCSSCGGSYRVWDRFTFGADAHVTEIDARLYFSAPQSVNYSVWDVTRSVQLFGQTFAYADLDLEPLPYSDTDRFYDVRVFPLGLDLLAGSYYLSIFSQAGTLGWSQVLNTVDGNSFQLFGSGGTNRDNAFRIIGYAQDVPGSGAGSIPEPASVALVALGLFGLGVVRRRQPA